MSYDLCCCKQPDIDRKIVLGGMFLCKSCGGFFLPSTEEGEGFGLGTTRATVSTPDANSKK